MNKEKIIGDMQNKELFLEFIQFCDEQPKDKSINHSSWGSCAVGDFISSKGESRDEAYKFSTAILGCGLDYNFSKETLNQVVAIGRVGIETYGKFTEFLKSYLPVIDEVV